MLKNFSLAGQNAASTAPIPHEEEWIQALPILEVTHLPEDLAVIMEDAAMAMELVTTDMFGEVLHQPLKARDVFREKLCNFFINGQKLLTLYADISMQFATDPAIVKLNELGIPRVIEEHLLAITRIIKNLDLRAIILG